MLVAERHKRFLIPKEEIIHRIAGFQSTLKEKGLSLAWIDHLTDLYYYAGSVQNGILLIPAGGEPEYFVKKSLKRAEVESSLEVKPYPGRKRLVERVKALLGERGKLGLAFDVTNVLPYVWLTGNLEGISVEDTSTAIRLQKAVKSKWEIGQIKKAVEQATVLFREMGVYLRAGITELELSASIEGRLRVLGHGGTLRIRGSGSDMVIITVVSGDSALYPTNFDGPSGGEGPYPAAAAGSGWKKIKEGETVIVDMVTFYNGYYADNARTFYVGQKIPQKVVEAHSFCQTVLDRLEQVVHPGRNCAAIYEEVKSWVENCGIPEGFMGYGENRVKFFGHGVGLELDEYPIIAEDFDLELKPGMIVAMEPKAYLKGIGPVGVENTYLVTEDGCKSLCTVGQDIIRIS